MRFRSRNGRYIWDKPPSERNEALDAAVYARAAAWEMGIDRWSESRWRDREAALGLLGEPERKPKASGPEIAAPSPQHPVVPLQPTPAQAQARPWLRPGAGGRDWITRR